MIKEFFNIWKEVLIKPRYFFRRMVISEGLRKPFLFVLLIFYLKNVLTFIISLISGHFYLFHRRQLITKVSLPIFIIYLVINPFLEIFILWFISKIINRIALFFGGVGNFEGAFKILCYSQSAYLFTPLLPFVYVYGIVLTIIGLYEVYRIDWVSTFATLFFSLLSASIIGMIILLPPAILLGIIMAPKF